MHHRVATRSALVYTCNQRPGYRHTPMARTVRLALSQAAQTATTSPEATESTAKKRTWDLGRDSSRNGYKRCSANRRYPRRGTSPLHCRHRPNRKPPSCLHRHTSKAACGKKVPACSVGEQSSTFCSRGFMLSRTRLLVRDTTGYVCAIFCTPPRRLSKLDHSTTRRRGVSAEKGGVGFDCCPTFVTELVVAG